MSNPLLLGKSEAGRRRKNCGKPQLATESAGSSGVLIDRRRWPSNPDQQLFCCTDPLDQGTLPPPVWLRRLTASNPIDTTIDVCASTSGSIAWGPRCWHARCSVSRRAVIGPGTVNTSRGHDGGRCDHDTGGWHDDAGTLIGVVPATADDLGGIGLNPSLRWVPFIGQSWPLTSLTQGGRNGFQYNCRPHGEFCPPENCGVLHGHTSIGIEPG